MMSKKRSRNPFSSEQKGKKRSRIISSITKDYKSSFFALVPLYEEHVQTRFIHTAEIATELSEELSKGNHIIKVTGAIYQDQTGFDRQDDSYLDNRSYEKLGGFTGANAFNVKKVAAAHTVGINVDLKTKNEDIDSFLSRTTFQTHTVNSHGPERILDKQQKEFVSNFNHEEFRKNPSEYFKIKMVIPALESLKNERGKRKNSQFEAYQADFDKAIRATESMLRPQPTALEKLQDPTLRTAPHVQLSLTLSDQLLREKQNQLEREEQLKQSLRELFV